MSCLNEVELGSSTTEKAPYRSGGGPGGGSRAYGGSRFLGTGYTDEQKHIDGLVDEGPGLG